MSFWDESPGPSWWDCIETLNPCRTPPSGICNTYMASRRLTQLPAGFRFVNFLPRHAKDLEKFLKEHFTIYPRCKIALTEARIHQGLLLDHWIGVGIYTLDKKLVASCISKPLGRLKLPHETLNQSGVVDYFCVHSDYRKQGFAKAMLDELGVMTAKQGRLVHVFLKEGFPLFKLPPLYTSRYISRERGTPGEAKEYFGSMGIGLHGPIQSYTHADYLPLRHFVANLPYELNGDSELYSFCYKGHSVFLCMTDLHHRTVPEGKRIGELAWMLPQTPEVPLSIQRLAVETCVDCSSYEIVLMDKQIPHSKGWQNDAGFSWYIFNYKPGGFFSVKPFWIF